jgi:hypothetical protein
MCHRYRTPLCQPDVVGCGWKAFERKKDELPMKLLDHPKILTARRSSSRPHKLLHVVVKMRAEVEEILLAEMPCLCSLKKRCNTLKLKY